MPSPHYLITDALAEVLISQGFMIKDSGLLDSAVNRPRASVFGTDAYATLELKAAAMTQSIIKNHPMIDGNKRSAWIALNYFLVLNGSTLAVSQEQAFDFVIGVATDLLSLEDMATWISAHRVSLEARM
jgi:death-on-curing protein